ncbi:MAG TPA: helix-turn-helix domain-containing protein [Clostridiaceae bacterium]
MNIGENIRKKRKDAGLTMKQLSEKVGLSVQAIGNYERGDREPSFEILNKISLALNSTISDFLDESDVVQKAQERHEVSSNFLPKYGYEISYIHNPHGEIDEGTYNLDIPYCSITKIDSMETKTLTLREFDIFIDSIENFIDFSFMNLNKKQMISEQKIKK